MKCSYCGRMVSVREKNREYQRLEEKASKYKSQVRVLKKELTRMSLSNLDNFKGRKEVL